MRSGDGRALVVAAGGGIGDTLLAGVTAHALRTRYAQVDALVLPAHAEVAAHDPVYDRILAFGTLRATAATVRDGRYDAAVVTWATLRTALVPFLAGIPRRAGQARRLYSGLFTHRVVVRSERGDRRTHWTQILLDYTRALGVPDAGTLPAFIPDAADRRAAAALLAAHAIGEAYVVLHPTRGIAAVNERWPVDGLAALARALQARTGLPVIVTGAAGDAGISAEIAARGGATSVAGQTTIGGFGALASAARAVVAMDSGPMHVAAATGVPTVGIFALQSDEPDRWAPRGARVATVRPTYPCPRAHRKETCPDFPCVRDLDVAGVLAALDGLLRAPGEAPTP